MREIEVGEYVRFENGEIGKVIDIKENPARVVYSEYGEIDLISDITKHSKNIIDLIEVGDIVEILLNSDLKYTQKYQILTQEMVDEVKKDLTSIEYLVSILTHEQYSQNCYKVVE